MWWFDSDQVCFHRDSLIMALIGLTLVSVLHFFKCFWQIGPAHSTKRAAAAFFFHLTSFQATFVKFKAQIINVYNTKP